MSMNEFQEGVDRVNAVLRAPGIDGLPSMGHEAPYRVPNIDSLLDPNTPLVFHHEVGILDDGAEPGPPLDEHLYEPLLDWWKRISDDDAEAAAAKAAEYGSRDLTELGRKLAALMGWDDVPDRMLSELGCWFYIAGKVERAFESLAHQRLPSDDTIHDVTVYSMMIRRIREEGAWR